MPTCTEQYERQSGHADYRRMWELGNPNSNDQSNSKYDQAYVGNQ